MKHHLTFRCVACQKELSDKELVWLPEMKMYNDLCINCLSESMFAEHYYKAMKEKDKNALS